MRYVRIMTFNVQLLSEVPLIGPSSGSESVDRAKLIVDAFQKLPPEELPDIVTFNECFNNDARDVLINGLSGIYGTRIAKFDDCFLDDDSGLAVYSRFSLMQIPGTGGAKFKFYSYPNPLITGDRSDRLACKGVAVVRFETPLGSLTLAFSHTQAFYDYEDEYRKRREEQLADIGTTIAQVNGAFPAAPWTQTIAMGDFNIIGNGIPSASPESEWFSEFAHPGRIFTDAFYDGWRTFNKPPTTPLETDPGFTNNNLEAGKDGHLPVGLLSRLDYICFSRIDTPRTFVPQHMRTRFRNLSDHWSLEADIHWSTANCTPSTAMDGLSAPQLIPKLRISQLDIRHAGSYQWVFVNKGGTFTVLQPNGLEISLYTQDNLSTAWKPYDRVKVSDLGVDGLESAMHQIGASSPVGFQYAVPGPFFIRVRGGADNPDFTGNTFLGVFEHTGQNPQTAFALLPWSEPFTPPLPAGQPNGANDECWFRAQIGRAHSGMNHESTFLVENGTGNGIHVEFFKGGMVSESNVVNADPQIEIAYTTGGAETVFLRMRRNSINDVNFKASWQSGLTFLRSVPNFRPMVLRCVDETGADWPGSDEIRLRLYADDMLAQFFQTEWNGVDTDEMLKLEGLAPEIAFIKFIDVNVVEDDDGIFDDADSTRISALGVGDGITKSIEQSFDVQSGTYRFECTLCRWQQG